MYLVADVGVVIFSIISLSPGGTFGGVEYPGTIAPNVPKERLVRLYLDIYPQNVPTAQKRK